MTAFLENPKVSVITVCLNAAETLEDTFISVANQAYDNIEYIVIDGGSTDGTLDLIHKYEKHISYWNSSPDSGIYDAINNGLARCTGELIGIINADDWYDAGAVQAVVRAFAANPKAGVFHGALTLVYPDKRIKQVFPSARQTDRLRRSMIIHHPTCFIRRDVYEKWGRFNLQYKIAADYELLLRFYSQGVRFQAIEQSLASMRTGGISITQPLVAAGECRDIRKLYGVSALIAEVIYCYECIRQFAKKIAIKTGLKKLEKF